MNLFCLGVPKISWRSDLHLIILNCFLCAKYFSNAFLINAELLSSAKKAQILLVFRVPFKILAILSKSKEGCEYFFLSFFF